MYIYELPFNVNKELCRLLDHDDIWKEAAGIHMNYSPFDVNEIEQEARRCLLSPTDKLLVQWGQQNHRVDELFLVLHRMKHVPAMRLLKPYVETKFHALFRKHSANTTREKDTAAVDENANNHKVAKVDGSDNFLPLPVMLIEKGEQMTTSSKLFNIRGEANTDDTSTENISSQNGLKSKDIHSEFMMNVSAIPLLGYDELREATANWSEQNLLGRGGFGQVYKGEWKLLPVAVKRLKGNDGKNKELIREMCLNQYRHDNILPLYGYSLGGPEACLVYQLMSGGSLEQRLRLKTRHPPLSWSQRYRVAHGVARGLQYLHKMADTPLIHGDIKPANILLDQCTIPKIGDFGLARKGPYGEERTHLKVSRVHGTRAYLPDDYLSSRCLSAAVDVFSFGVVVAEAASALAPADRGRTHVLLSEHLRAMDGVDFATLEDPILKNSPHSNPDLCREFISLGILCTHPSRKQRPTMFEVYKRIDAMNCPDKNLQNFVPRP